MDSSIINPSDIVSIDNAIRSTVDGIIINDEGKSVNIIQSVTQVSQVICEIEKAVADQPMQENAEEPIKLASKYVLM